MQKCKGGGLVCIMHYFLKRGFSAINRGAKSLKYGIIILLYIYIIYIIYSFYFPDFPLSAA